jgi:hypothetical protein
MRLRTKDVVEGPKTRIPAPASLATTGKSRSFSNLSAATDKNNLYIRQSSGIQNGDYDRENDGVFERAGVLDTESRDGVDCLLEGLDETEDFLFTFSLLSNEYSSSL